jgi:hypothetical protein
MENHPQENRILPAKGNACEAGCRILDSQFHRGEASTIGNLRAASWRQPGAGRKRVTFDSTIKSPSSAPDRVRGRLCGTFSRTRE